MDVKEAVENTLSGGEIQYKSNRFGNILLAVGKLSFDDTKLEDNIMYVCVHVHVCIRERA